MIFVDTGVWYACFIRVDPKHQECRQLIKSHSGQLLTTDYVVDELLTLLSIRGHRHVAQEVGSSLWTQAITKLHWINQNGATAAWEIFQEYRDKQWSFTDCTSYAAMQSLAIKQAFSLDEHFHQFGFAEVLPGKTPDRSSN